jgi:PIN domain nuclease of toxin-antitoxin system
MNLLLDTHTFIWFMNGDKNLPKQIINKIIDIDNKCFISVASLWEIAIKISLGKLSIKEGFNKISSFIINNEMEILPVQFQHLQTLLKLRYFHRDPFDRILIAQAISEGFEIATNDKNFEKYNVKIIWK